MTPITYPDTLIVGDDELLREGLSLLLQSADYAVSGSFSQMPDRIDCDLLIVCSDRDGTILSHVGCLGRMPSRTKLVVLMSRGTDAGLHADVFARAAGILNRASSPKKLLIAVQAVLAGVMVHDATLLDSHDGAGEPPAVRPTSDGPILLARGFPAARAGRDTIACSLSLREREILSSLADGNSNKVIARKHNITEATVKVHVRHILRKLNFNNRTQAALWAKEYSMMTA
ncbi:HTH-type transcriptional regulator MalT [Methylobacterium crusticola]|uniref:HTH-type transcriptional regulator MalT n=2 Tax=Methylobacterium crusticola TaxID=1697972 RepID=A0ABQ4R734_9HYPH|nr:HTH-type transcriptional regulator MalT [Methylobacterium crusticola]